MDFKLSVYLTNMLRNIAAACTLYQDLQLKQHAAAALTKVAKGRQILFMINESFETNRQETFVFTIVDLSGLPWLGDREMATLRNRWDTVAESIQDKLSDATLADLLSAKMDKPVELHDAMAHYWRMPEGHVDPTYKYL